MGNPLQQQPMNLPSYAQISAQNYGGPYGQQQPGTSQPAPPQPSQTKDPFF